MREMTKILLSACTVCALGQGNIARAQSSQAPGQTPSSQPSPSPDTPAGSPAGASDSQPTPPDDPPTESPTPTVPDTGQPSPPDSSSTSTTTTTTTTTSVGGTAATEPPLPPPPVTTGTESENDMFGFEWHNPNLRSGIGVSVLAGGGVVQFTNSAMRSTTSDIGGLWGLHVTAGTHLPLALDLAYVGTATHIAGLPTGSTRTLLGSAAEGTLRWNVLPTLAWTPYVFGGVGYQRYDVKGGDISLSDTGMNTSDNLLSVPAGLGFVWRGNNGLVADVHGTYRFTWFQDLLLKNGAPITGTNSNDFVKLNNWEASAAIGYEF